MSGSIVRVLVAPQSGADEPVYTLVSGPTFSPFNSISIDPQLLLVV